MAERIMAARRPRFGLTLLCDGIVAKLTERQNTAELPYVSHFGWQFEKQFFARAAKPELAGRL